MKDYNKVETGFANEFALSFQPGAGPAVEFLDVINASGRFLQLAGVVSDHGFLGWQISADRQGKLSSAVFTSTGVNVTAEDYGWIFPECVALETDRVSFLENLYEGNRKVYMLSYRSEPTKCYEVSEDEIYGFCEDECKISADVHFEELMEMLAEAGAVIRMIADPSKKADDYGLVLISFPDEISLRMRGMITMAMPSVDIEDIGHSLEVAKDAKHLPDYLFRSIMSNLLYVLISRVEKEEEPMKPHEQDKTLAAVAEESTGTPSDQNDYFTVPIEELELSIRSYNCLKRAGISTIGALRTMSDEDLQHIRNLGRKSISEIKEKLAGYLQAYPDPGKIPSLKAARYYDMLDELVGLKEAKHQIRKIAAFARMRQDISGSGDKKMPVSLNMEFIGNPGTAKTTVARISAGIFHEIGLLSSKEMIEVGRADLIGKYEGQTAGKVKEVFSDAKGKMLFIDEAYSLVECWEGAYGDEAINTIVQEMENNREDTIVVFAGYPDKMKDFFDRNPGLRSRVPFSVRFDDYSTDEMLEIAKIEAQKRGFSIAAEASEKVMSICHMAAGNSKAGNGRFCRNLVEGAILEYALRNYGGTEKPSGKDFILEAEDFLLPDHLKKPPVTTPIGFAV